MAPHSHLLPPQRLDFIPDCPTNGKLKFQFLQECLSIMSAAFLSGESDTVFILIKVRVLQDFWPEQFVINQGFPCKWRIDCRAVLAYRLQNICWTALSQLYEIHMYLQTVMEWNDTKTDVRHFHWIINVLD